MQQLLKSQKKQGSSVINNQSSRTRTKSNANGSAVNQTVDKKLVKSTIKQSSVSQFMNVGQNGSGANKNQTFVANTDSSQYYSNGLTGPHTKTMQA